jgi:uncharacterized protein
MWVIDQPGKDGRLYLGGTLHLLRQEDHPLPVIYQQAYEQTQFLIQELPPGSGPEAGRKIIEAGRLSDGLTLERQLSPALATKLEKAAARTGLKLSHYRPWCAALLLAANEYAQMGAKAEYGVETAFEKRALAEQRPVRGLESVDFQVGLFSQLTEAQQITALEQTLVELEKAAENFEALIRAWRQADGMKLEQLLIIEAQLHPELKERFLTERNQRWLPQLEASLVRGHRTLALVGAGHLVGEAGLLKLFQNKGYRVRHHTEVE